MKTIKSDIDYKTLEKKINKAIKMQKTDLRVGFFSNARYPQGEYVASVAYWHNYGKGHNPARPFFTNAITKNKNKWFSVLKNDLSKQNKQINLKSTFETLGNIMVGDIKKSITELKTPPLSPITIARKKSSNPLIDTGLLRSSVTYKVGSF